MIDILKNSANWEYQLRLWAIDHWYIGVAFFVLVIVFTAWAQASESKAKAWERKNFKRW